MPPYDPNANPYIINPLELPSNQTAAAMVPAKNIGTTAQWCQSPYYTPNWGNQVPTSTQATSPVCTASVTSPDVTTADRTACAQAALAAEQARLQARTDNLTQDIAAVTAVP